MTTLSARTARSVVRRPPAPRPVLVGAGVLAVVAILGTSALLRWSGQLPFGSDNDEYLLVAEQLRWLEPPVVAGVEGTKYPLGYPALLAAVGALGLPVASSAMVLNVLAIGLASAAAAQTARVLRLGGTAAFAAAAYIAAAPALWESAYSVMPDVLLVLVVAAAVGHLARTRTTRDVLLLGAFVAIAAALKSVGLLVGLGLGAGLMFVPHVRRWAWVPAAVASAVTALMMALVAPYPEHTTGYAATFWLTDPYDASQGTVTPFDVARRITTRAGFWFEDLGEAVVGIHAPTAAAIATAVLLVTLAIGAYATSHLRRPRGPTWTADQAARTFQLSPLPPPGGPHAAWPVLGFVAVYFLGLLVWPYESYRFGLPLIPVAAAGVALIASRLGRIPVVGTALVVVAAAAFTWWGGAWLSDQSAAEAGELAELHVAVDELGTWIRQNVRPGEELASFDYREVARATDRTVLPLGYTTDVGALLDASAGEGADYLVVIRDLYPRRERLADRLVAANEDRFRIVYDRPRVEIYRIEQP